MTSQNPRPRFGKLYICPTSSAKMDERSSSFISKFRNLLSEEKYRNAIRWSEGGDAIVIPDVRAFTCQVLAPSANIFPHRSFASFQASLNRYGFRKTRGNPAKNVKFTHVHFKRDSQEPFRLVRPTRKVSPSRHPYFLRGRSPKPLETHDSKRSRRSTENEDGSHEAQQEDENAA